MVRTPTAQGPLFRNCSGPGGMTRVVVGVWVVVGAIIGFGVVDVSNKEQENNASI